MINKLFILLVSSAILTSNPLFAMNDAEEGKLAASTTSRSPSVYYDSEIARYNVEDEASYRATLEDAGRTAPFIHITITHNFLQSLPSMDAEEQARYQAAARSRTLINLETGQPITDESILSASFPQHLLQENSLKDRIGDVCENLVRAHPNVSSIELLQERYYAPVPSKTLVFHQEIPIHPSFLKDIKHDYPLQTLLTPTLPELTSLTVYNGQLNCISIVQMLLSNAPKLNQLYVRTHENENYKKSGTANQFATCWELMKERLEVLEWPGAHVTDETAESMASFLSTTPTLKYLNLEDALISEKGMAILKEAVTTNPKGILFNVDQVTPLTSRITPLLPGNSIYVKGK